MMLRYTLRVLVSACLFIGAGAFAADEKPEGLPYWADFANFTLVQAWLFNDTTLAPAKPDFNIRRAQLGLSGQPSPEAHWFLMVDAAKIPGISVNKSTGVQDPTKDIRILQDVGVAVRICNGLEVILGQFKIQTTAEPLAPTTELPLPERSLVSRTYGDRREPGGMVSYTSGVWHGTVMLSNGKGPNVDDTNSAKDVTSRIDANVTPHWTVGAFTQAGDFSYSTKAAWGANIWYKVPDFFARLEGVAGSALGVSSNGVTADAGYSVTPKIQPVVRYEIYTPPSTVGPAAARAWSVGMNYFVSGYHAKIQLALTGMTNMSAISGSPTFTNGSDGSVAVLSFQGAL